MALTHLTLKASRTERKQTKRGGSSPDLRNTFDLPPEELDFSLGTMKTVHGVFLFVNISS